MKHRVNIKSILDSLDPAPIRPRRRTGATRQRNYHSTIITKIKLTQDFAELCKELTTPIYQPELLIGSAPEFYQKLTMYELTLFITGKHLQKNPDISLQENPDISLQKKP